MTMTLDEMLQQMDTAFRSITDLSEMGESVLSPEKLDQFIREMQHSTVVLPQTRFYNMEAHITDIDRTAFIGRVLRSGTQAGGEDHRNLDENEYANPNFNTNKLIAQEMQAITSLRDRALRRNIEQGNFENTLVSLFGEAAGRDLEEYAFFGDTEWSHSDDDVLSKTDGWLRRASHKLYGRDVTGQVARDFDPTAESWPENLFQQMIEAVPKRYFQDPTEWRLWVNWDVMDAYRDKLRDRNTSLGDTVQTQNVMVAYKGIPVEFAPVIERHKEVDLATDNEVSRDRMEGNVAMLSHPDNMAWGVFHEVNIEREREAKQRRTDFVLTVEADADYEDENAVVVGMIDKANPNAE